MLKISKGNKKNFSALRIHFKGNVQGVGFRPLLFKIAKRLKLKGWITNTASGVLTEVEGNPRNIQKLITNLKYLLPHHARIEKITKEKIKKRNFDNLSIISKKDKKKAATDIPPDLTICPDCLEELLDKSDRRYNYPFINCTNCGPRFTITKEVPYDRVNTTMASFKMCENCQKEYETFTDRRFHAQPNACPICGPKISLLSRSMEITADEKTALDKTINLLKKGKIVAVKSLGGYHICCDALNINAVQVLRKRKNRPHKPFAVMVKDIKTAKKYAHLNKEEEKLLKSVERPIVLLKKKKLVPDNIAPRNAYIGIMLPYTPLHYLLFSFKKSDFEMLVMTSGNRTDEPICRSESELKEKLFHIADYFLVHNRKIHNRCDDSILFNFNAKSDGNIFIRKSRGFVPYKIHINALKSKTYPNILATGVELKNTFCLTRNGNAYVSQYVGDMDNHESLVFYKESQGHFQKYLDIKPSIIVHDLHPNYMTTIYAKKLKEKNKNLKMFAVQHHHAHIASVIAENNIDKPLIGFAFDGTGLGLDGKIWGGESFLYSGGNFKRLSHFDNFLLPGGDIATKEIWRLGVSVLTKIDISKLPEHYKKYPALDVVKMIKNKINSIECSSVGRIFDAVASILDIKQEVSFEAQAAIEMESIALDIPVKKGYNFNIFYNENTECFIISLKEIIKGILRDKENGINSKIISAKFHLSIVEIIVYLAKKFRKKYKINDIAISGGVFQNRIILSSTIEKLRKSHFNVYWNKVVPPNDGGISLGQAYLASKRQG
ncbi:MAG: carbamoyltransferase HypF [Elusimicrobia bacterium]|nr:carbamoyltransferase HypF [Elusimicrobiota bacterium]